MEIGYAGPLALNIKQAAAMTGLSRSTLYAALRDGRLRSYKVGARLLFAPEHLLAFLKANETHSDQPEDLSPVAQRQLRLLSADS